MGSGKNGSFDIHPDWQQWGIMAVSDRPVIVEELNADGLMKKLYGGFISRWIRLFNCETWTVFLQPLEGHGKWDGKQPFGDLPKQTEHKGLVTVLTRATIRLSKLRAFWQNVDGVSTHMDNATGFIHSLGIGEIPLIKQATFSTWESRDAMKQFAYKMQEHAEVIRKTRQGNWYREELFVRFKPLKTIGSINGKDPLAGKL